MNVLRCTMLAFVAIVFFSLPAGAADGPLPAIPDDAGVVIRWRKPTQTVQKVVDFVSRVDGEYGGKLRLLSLGVGLAISNPQLAGVDAERDWYVAVFPSADGDPGILFAVPASDIKAMKGAIIGQYQFVTYKNWLLYTEDALLAKRVQEQIDGTAKSIGTVIDAESAALMDRGDLSAFFNVPQLRETYKGSLDQFRDEVESQMAQIQNLPLGAPGMNRKLMIEVYSLYSRFLKGMLQSVEDAESVTVALQIGKEGVGLKKLVRIKAQSSTDKFLLAHKSSDMQQLRRLPPGSHAYVGLSGNINQLMSWGMKLSSIMLAGNPDAKQALDESSKEMAKLEFGAYLMSFGVGDAEGGLIRLAMVTEVKPTDKMRDVTRKMTRAMSNIDTGFIKQTTELRIDAEKYGENRADVVVTSQNVDPKFDLGGMQSQINRMLYGEEGQVQRIVYLKNVVLQTMGGGRESMEKLLKAQAAPNTDTPLDTSGSSKEFAIVRSRLSKEANVVVIVDLPAIVADFFSAVVQASPFPIPVDAAALKKDLGGKRSFTGFSMSSKPQTLHVTLYVPLTQAQKLVKLARTIQRLNAQPGI